MYQRVREVLKILMGEANHKTMTENPREDSNTGPQEKAAPNFHWEPIVWPGWEPLIPPRELWVGPQDPVLHFFRWPWEYRAYLTLLCGLRRDAAVLELGCNHGRTMLGLLDYLQAPGRYEGLDIMPAQIHFAQEHIHSRYPIFNFTLANVHNALYHPQGQLKAAEYRFPYPNESFDVAYAASLFTHLVPSETSNYLKEARRVLRRGGQCLFSVFILDFYNGKGTSAWEFYEFEYLLPGYTGVGVHNLDMPEQLIAYDRVMLESLAREAELKVRQVIPGYWSKAHKTDVNEQDLVLLEVV
jgi:SAM-dependent methyltransferase